ncbi:DNA cytosine methyltransferase [Streptomyces sp. NPDC059718]
MSAIPELLPLPGLEPNNVGLTSPTVSPHTGPTGAASARVTSTHLFSGGCGDLLGFEAAGFRPVFAANHAAPAIATVRHNFPGIGYSQCDINNMDFRAIPDSRVLVGSPICKEAAPAGRHSTPGKPKPGAQNGRAPGPEWPRTRATAWDLIRAAEIHDYDVVCGENVADFATRWNLFEPWLNVWDALGYNTQIVSINAAHIGGPGNEPAPQHRHRILFCFTKKHLELPDLRVRPEAWCGRCGPVQGVQVWAKRFHAPSVRKVGTYGQYHYGCPNKRCGSRVEPVVRAIRDHIDLSKPDRRFGLGRSDRREFTPYKDETRRKVAVGLERFGHREPFLVILRNHCTVQSLDEPISAITAEGNHHMLVHPGRSVDDCRIQMIPLRTKARAQRFPDGHVFLGKTAADLTRQVGNAVPVSAAQWLGERVMPVLV